MFKKFSNYLDKEYIKQYCGNRIEYCFKDVPSTFREYYEELKKKEEIFWKPENFPVVYFSQGFKAKKIKDIKKEMLQIKRSMSDYPYDIESIPSWYFKFLQKCSELSIFKGGISFSLSTAMDILCIKPSCLNGKFYIGKYSDITPKSCPIFTDESGGIYVYDAANFRNYPIKDTKKEIERYKTQNVRLLAYWKDIDTFLIEETERLKSIFINKPSIFGVTNCAPYNIQIQ